MYYLSGGFFSSTDLVRNDRGTVLEKNPPKRVWFYKGSFVWYILNNPNIFLYSIEKPLNFWILKQMSKTMYG